MRRPPRPSSVTWPSNHPDVEVEVTEGGQPLYPYYFGLE